LKVVLYLFDHTNQDDGCHETVFKELGMKREVINAVQVLIDREKLPEHVKSIRKKIGQPNREGRGAEK
jgi:hypothetical protein